MSAERVPAQLVGSALPAVSCRYLDANGGYSSEPRAGWAHGLMADCELALLIAPHDLHLARALLREPIRARGYLLTDRNKYNPNSFFAALALLDPRVAVAAVEEIAPDHPQKSYLLRDRMRQTVATTLAYRSQEQLRERIRRITGLPELEEDQ